MPVRFYFTFVDITLANSFFLSTYIIGDYVSLTSLTYLPFFVDSFTYIVFSIFQMIMEKKFQPVIIFSFSRRECEHHAMSMSKLDFNSQEEKDVVEQVFRNAILCLNEEDRELPAIELILPLLLRGIAVHHSGLLPVIKELVELLFQEGLVKALFATETVSSPLAIILSFLSLYKCFS